MTIPFKVKLLTNTAKAPERANEGDLWDIFADEFLSPEDLGVNKGYEKTYNLILPVGNRVLVKTGIALELPIKYSKRRRIGRNKEELNNNEIIYALEEWSYRIKYNNKFSSHIEAYAVADIRPRSGLALKHGITVLNSPGTIDNSYRKEIGVILYNAGHEPYTISKGDKICQMLIRPLYPSKMEIVKDIKDTGRGAYGSTGK